MAVFPDSYDKGDVAFFTFIGTVVAAVIALILIGAFALLLNMVAYTERSTQNGVVCIVRHSELTNSVIGVDCPKPFTNSK